MSISDESARRFATTASVQRGVRDANTAPPWICTSTCSGGSGGPVAGGAVHRLEQAPGQLAELAAVVDVVVAGARQRARGVEQHGGANVGGQPAEPLRGALRSERVGHPARIAGVPLSRISWLVTVGICLVAALLLLLNGYYGYSGVLLAVGAAAVVNLL